MGIGARGAEIVLRRQDLTLHNALLWGEQHLFLSAILPEGRLHLRVQAALVEHTRSRVGHPDRGYRGRGRAAHYGGDHAHDLSWVLTEKYARYEREETHAENETSYVLVVPKAIQLKASDLVTVQEGPAKAVYYVTICHVLDPYKNEYEIVWQGDV